MNKILKGLIIAISVVTVGCSDYEDALNKEQLSKDLDEIDCQSIVTQIDGSGDKVFFSEVASGSGIIKSCEVEIKAALYAECTDIFRGIGGVSKRINPNGPNGFQDSSIKRTCGDFFVANLNAGYELSFKRGTAFLTISDRNKINSNSNDSHYMGRSIESVTVSPFEYVGHKLNKVTIRSISGDERVVFTKEKELADSMVDAVRHTFMDLQSHNSRIFNVEYSDE